MSWLHQGCVSRDHHDEVIATLRAALEAAQQMLMNERDERMSCTRDMLAMKKDGFTISTPKTITKHEPSKLEEAIASRANGNHALRRHLAGYAANQRQLGVAESEIERAIIKWRSDEDEDGG